MYTRAVEKLALSLARNNAAIIELNAEDAAIVHCALESAKLYFRTRPHSASFWNASDWLKLSGYLAAPARDMFFYRAGRYYRPFLGMTWTNKSCMKCHDEDMSKKLALYRRICMSCEATIELKDIENSLLALRIWQDFRRWGDRATAAMHAWGFSMFGEGFTYFFEWNCASSSASRRVSVSFSRKLYLSPPWFLANFVDIRIFFLSIFHQHEFWTI